MGEENNKNMDYIDKRQNNYTDRNIRISKTFIIQIIVLAVICYLLFQKIYTPEWKLAQQLYNALADTPLLLIVIFFFVGAALFSFSLLQIILIVTCAFRAIKYLEALVPFSKGGLVAFYVSSFFFHLFLSSGVIAVTVLYFPKGARIGLLIGALLCLFISLGRWGLTQENLVDFAAVSQHYWDEKFRWALGSPHTVGTYLFIEVQTDREKHPRKARFLRILVILFVVLIVVFSIILIRKWALAEENPNIESDSSTEKDQEQYDTVTFYNGEIYNTPTSECLAPLSIKASRGKSYYVVLDHIKSPTDDMSFMIKPNSTAEVTVPLGEYEIYYACGDTWYGTEHHFGSETSYNKCEGTFEFYFDGEYYQGWSLELIEQYNGNMDTDVIPASEFPG